MLDGNASEVWRAPDDADAWRGEPSVSPVYPASKPMSAPEMRDAVGAALRVLARDPAAREDPLPRDMVAEQQLMDWAQVSPLRTSLCAWDTAATGFLIIDRPGQDSTFAVVSAPPPAKNDAVYHRWQKLR